MTELGKKKLIMFLLVLLMCMVKLFFAYPVLAEAVPVVASNNFYTGKVIAITDEEVLADDFGAPLTQQYIKVELKSGEQKGNAIDMLNEFPVDNDAKRISVGDKIIVGSTYIAGEEHFYVNDIYRLNAVYGIVIFFVVLTLLFTRTAGLRAFVGLGISFAMIFYFLIPQILAGYSPFFAAIVTAFVIMAFALFVAHGCNLRTTIAFIGTGITIVCTVIFSQLFVSIARLSGLGSEEAFFLQNAGDTVINVQGLLLAGIIIGTLGVLDDSTTAQAAAIEEIYHADNSISARMLYKKGMSVGREHIISLVNTLILAYTGVSLPLLLLFMIYQQPLWVTLNSEIIIEEVIRMMVGSSALVLAVPITTIIAVWFLAGNGKNIVKKYQKNIFFRSGGVHHYH